MQFDTVLKTLFQSSRLLMLESLTGAPIREWINVELPKAQMNKLDLVAWLTDDRLYHLELQSGNDVDMPWRMLEYYLLLWKRYAVAPVQQVIYVGSRPMAMSAEIQHENLTFRYRVIDMRELDSEVLLQSPAIEDNLLAILCRLNDTRAAVRRILARIAQLPPSQRLNAMSQLLVLSGLRRLEYVIKEESAQMPVTIDLMENRVIRDFFLQGKQEGKQEGELKGRAEGEQEGARKEALLLLTRLLERRFGPLPEDAARKLNAADLAALEDWSLRLLDAPNLEQVFQSA
jgi:predicted transposase YdaD